MKKLLLVASAMAFAFPLLAQAETLKFPSDAPIASVTIPHSWAPKETETGIDATSDDSAVYFSIDVADEKSSDKVVSDAIDFLTKSGVKIDPATQKDEGDNTINGMKMSTLGWQGTDNDGAVDVELAFLSPVPGKLLVVTYWGSKDSGSKHDKELTSILSSLVAVK
ncbi:MULTISPECIES: histidine kinase [Rhizobium]|uniref:Histidine kinase n=1 Tax=Rhizobium rhododendri TaxID=2506430 RepID=A0ABY8IID8_9HYPH|nr:MULTISPECIES: histidine kinase [Rhizobium]MBZ5761123.1 histidine kinase [Rhizobium sp. VS19-DR96]MBZ5767189.1 histidine kinase [Rhizobium sp. VS19-DR129.2]MBZ5773522.1 histidine kinase [Rhizobium sp. VS19-DRK62.2]MBZ5785501.1 histidine kinase [Rhizobium sp. VS19-DR121]MBZ5802322.1 histidine kinase [Rhizobium sp. VS19-DR181]